MKNKLFKIIGIMLIFGIIMTIIQVTKVNKRYENDQLAIDANRKVTEVLHKEQVDDFTVYFYQPEDEPILVDYIYQDEEGFKAPSKKLSKQAVTEHQVIWHYHEKDGSHLVVISKCLFDPRPFTMRDSQNSTFKEVSFLLDGFEYTYYIATFDEASNYKIYINDEEIVNWDKI